MKIQAVLNEGFRFLSGLNIETAVLDATVLLAEALQVSKEKLFINLQQEITAGAYHIFKTYLELRRAGYPVSYIRKKKEFYDIEFYVDNRVLVPRPDSELLVEAAVEILKSHDNLTILHDLCTGSGCIAITLKKLFPALTISASDICKHAGEVFHINCGKILGMEIPFVVSDLFTGLDKKYDIITANPPYLSIAQYAQMKKLSWPEPEAALVGGITGLELSEKLVRAAIHFLNPGGYLLMESGFDCMDHLADCLNTAGFSCITIKKDLGGRNRVILGRYA